MASVDYYRNQIYSLKDKRSRFQSLKNEIEGSLVPALNNVIGDLNDAVASMKNGFVIDGVTADGDSIKASREHMESLRDKASGSVITAINNEISKINNSIYYYNDLIEDILASEEGE